jgi:hypothetical protein
MTREALLDSAGIEENRFHRIRAELAPDDAARLYADDIRQRFNLVPSQIKSPDTVWYIDKKAGAKL